MIASNDKFPWLEFIDSAAFCVKDGQVIAVNTAAKKRMLRIGTDIHRIVTANWPEYEALQSGELYLTVTLDQHSCSASVLRTEECDIFRIHSEADDTLQALALASVQLRIPLSNAMIAFNDLLRSLPTDSEGLTSQTEQLNRNLYQIVRIISNMSDADSSRNSGSVNMQTVNLSALIGEIVEKTQALCEGSGTILCYTGLDTPVYGLANPEKLERAVYNLLSNGLKYAPGGSTVTASLSKKGNQLSFTVKNPVNGVPAGNSFWRQHLREPAIEDPRSGLGLGMTLISSAAALHGGTVLVDRPEADTVRVTMTLTVSNDSSGTVCSPIMRVGDYAGGRDKGLIELSDILPADVYNTD